VFHPLTVGEKELRVGNHCQSSTYDGSNEFFDLRVANFSQCDLSESIAGADFAGTAASRVSTSTLPVLAKGAATRCPCPDDSAPADNVFRSDAGPV
jgi:hypothetical protein